VFYTCFSTYWSNSIDLPSILGPKPWFWGGTPRGVQKPRKTGFLTTSNERFSKSTFLDFWRFRDHHECFDPNLGVCYTYRCFFGDFADTFLRFYTNFRVFSRKNRVKTRRPMFLIISVLCTRANPRYSVTISRDFAYSTCVFTCTCGCTAPPNMVACHVLGVPPPARVFGAPPQIHTPMCWCIHINLLI
jgi:hypothetical protein